MTPVILRCQSASGSVDKSENQIAELAKDIELKLYNLYNQVSTCTIVPTQYFDTTSLVILYVMYQPHLYCMFHCVPFQDVTQKYRSKCRSLLFNLKDTKNQVDNMNEY